MRPIATAFLVSLALVSVSVASARADFIDEIPVTDQDMTLQCWAVAITSRLDVSASRTHDAPLKLSPKYLVYAKTKAEVLDLIFNQKFETYEAKLCDGNSKKCAPREMYYEQGAVLLDGIETARVYGIMPESAYGGFPKEDYRLFVRLNRFIAQWDKQRKKLDSIQAREKVEADLEAILEKYLGRPPRTFSFNGVKYTPVEFFEAYAREWVTARARELNYKPGGREGVRWERAFNGSKYEVLTTGNADRLRALVSESLKAGEPVLLQYKSYDDYHTQALGHIGFAVQGLPVVAPTKAKWRDTMTHYVLAIGGEWDRAGNLARIHLKNTWDLPNPKTKHYEWKRGFHWMETDFLPWLEAVEINEKLEPRLKGLGLL